MVVAVGCCTGSLLVLSTSLRLWCASVAACFSNVILTSNESTPLAAVQVDVLAALQAEMDKLNARLHQVQADEQAKAMAKSRIQDLALAELALWAQNAQVSHSNCT